MKTKDDRETIVVPELEEAIQEGHVVNECQWMHVKVPGEDYTVGDIIYDYYVSPDAKKPAYRVMASYISKIVGRRVKPNQIRARVSSMRREKEDMEEFKG